LLISTDGPGPKVQPSKASPAGISGDRKRRTAAAERLRSLAASVWKQRLSYLFIAPFFIAFGLFILVPIATAVAMSYSNFNALQPPRWVGWLNFQSLFSQDIVFLQHVVPNTFKFALFVGPVGFVLSLGLAWLISLLPQKLRIIYALAIYAPSLTAGAAMTVIWQVAFTGDRTGYLNSFLLKLGFVQRPVLFLLDQDYLLNIMIIISVWSSMGIGFLAMLAGILNVDKQLYEAGRIDGISSRLEEMWYITLPSMKPQLLFAAVMSIVGMLKSGGAGKELVGFPTPNYAGQLIVTHMEDYGFIRYELGYASAISVCLLALMLMLNQLLRRWLAPKGEDAL